MAMKTKTQTKTAPAKTRATAPKTAPKTEAAPKVFAAFLGKVLGGAFGIEESNFYARGMKYHADKGTAFPRIDAKTGTRKYPPIPADAFLAKIATYAAARDAQDNGFAWSRGAFDDIMVETFGAQVPKDWRTVTGYKGKI